MATVSAYKTRGSPTASTVPAMGLRRNVAIALATVVAGALPLAAAAPPAGAATPTDAIVLRKGGAAGPVVDSSARSASTRAPTGAPG